MASYAIVTVIAVVGLWVAIGARVLARHHQLSRFDALLVVFAAGAGADALSALEIAWLSSPMAHAALIASSLVGMLIAVEMVRLVAGGERVRPTLPQWRVMTGVLVVLLAAAAAVGSPMGPIATAQWQSDHAMAMYWLGYAVFQLVASVVMLRLLLQVTRSFEPGAMRQVGVLLVCTVVLGVLFGLSLVVLVIDNLGLHSGVGAAGYTYGSLQYLVLAAAYLRVRVARSSSRKALAAQMASVEPVWQMLRPVQPDLSLFDAYPDAATLGREELTWVCVRAVIEVRDWLHLLSRRLPVDAVEEAKRVASSLAPGRTADEVEGVATAGWIQRGLAHHPDLVRVPHSAPPREGRDIDEDLRLLAAVARVTPEDAHRVARAMSLPLRSAAI